MSGKLLSPFAKRRVALAVGLAGIVVFVFLLFLAFAGSGLLNVGGQKVEAIFPDGLNVVPRASEVRVSGIAVGAVDSVQLLPGDEDGVIVAMTVDGSVAVASDARATLRLKSILGEKYVDLEPGESPEPLQGPINETLVGTDFTTLAAGGPEAFDLNRALKGSTVEETLQRTAEAVPNQGQKLSDQLAELRVETDDMVAGRQDIVNTLDDLASLTTALVDSGDDLGRLMRSGQSIQDQMLDAVDRAKVNFARMDTAVQVIEAVFDSNAAAIDDVMARYNVIMADLETAWSLFRSGAQLPVAIWGLGPIGYNDPRSATEPNPFPPFTPYPIPPEVGR